MGNPRLLEQPDFQFGAWLMKCNPTIWDIQQFIADGHVVIEGWSLKETYRLAHMRQGDPCLLWVTDQGSIPGGVYATGQITGLPERAQGDEYWVDPEDGERVQPYADLELTMLATPLERERVQEEPGLADAEIFRQPWASNPGVLSRDEWRLISEML